MCAAEFFRQRPNFSLDFAEIICWELATLLDSEFLEVVKVEYETRILSPLLANYTHKYDQKPKLSRMQFWRKKYPTLYIK
jgi:hypothetical protein